MEQSVKDIFRGRLKELIEGKKETEGKKKKDIAADLGIAYNTMNYYLSGDRTPDIEILQKICTYFGVSPDYLLGYSGISTTDTKVRAIGEATGLSEINVERLMEQQKKFETYLNDSNHNPKEICSVTCPRDFVNSCINFLYGGDTGLNLDGGLMTYLKALQRTVVLSIKREKDKGWENLINTASKEELKKKINELQECGVVSLPESSAMEFYVAGIADKFKKYLSAEVDNLKE